MKDMLEVGPHSRAQFADGLAGGEDEGAHAEGGSEESKQAARELGSTCTWSSRQSEGVCVANRGAWAADPCVWRRRGAACRVTSQRGTAQPP